MWEVDFGLNRPLCYTQFPSKKGKRKLALAFSHSFSENLFRNFHDVAQFVPLLLFGEDIAVVGRCESALRADA